MWQTRVSNENESETGHRLIEEIIKTRVCYLLGWAKREGGNVWTFLRSLATDAADMTRLVHADKSKEMMQKRFVEQPSQLLKFFLLLSYLK